MSRLGKLPIKLADGMEAKIADGFIIIKNAKGELKQRLHPSVKIDIKEGSVKVNVNNPEDKKEKALWGLYFSLIRNMVQGLAEGFTKKLEVIGVGYRVGLSGKKITLNVGYSHPVIFDIPSGVEAQVEANVITLTSADKQLVGETAALIRKIRKPEPYKGKGIKYSDEIIRRKEGKAAAK
ncbi:MAG: 50S ribosomal protein L6 [Parcubacteria group bacterium ADurb.Bin316]|nr:MAG: 50S ribosomal protein L6 [Parcubacteria group bacterium ADurb.Bin316]HOZ56076.1 50S ribosomal protein L6 [bacterium]